MPLPAYGVAIGTYVSFARDPQDRYGRWYHGHLTIATPNGEYASALDVDTPSSLGVSYRLSYSLDPSAFTTVTALPDGFHTLAPNPTSGALDYLRSGIFRDLAWPTSLRPPAVALDWLSPAAKDAALTVYERAATLLGRFMPLPEFLWHRPWVRSTGDNALSALEGQLPGSRRVFIFGAPYTEGLGVHDVHMNQGDPAGTQWYATDGVWQDGCVLVQRPDARLFAWQVRFNSQAMETDAAGHPV